MRPRLLLPRWSVTRPTIPPTRDLPAGLLSVHVRAASPEAAVQAAIDEQWYSLEGYAISDAEPEVWRLRRPYRWRSVHVAGPRYEELEEARKQRVADLHRDCDADYRAGLGKPKDVA